MPVLWPAFLNFSEFFPLFLVIAACLWDNGSRKEGEHSMKKLLKKIFPLSLMLAAGFVCGILIGLYADRAAQQGLPGGLWGPLVVLFAGFILSIYLQTAAHEAGHLVLGLMSGYRFCSYRLGSLMLVKENGRLQLRRLKIAGTAGQCLMAPPPWSDDLPVIAFNLGGCLFNVLCSGLCLLLWLPLREHWLGALPMVIALMGLAMALMNGIPMRAGGVDNDGRNALHLGKDPTAKRAFWLQLKVCEAQAKGLRLCQMPEDWFICPQAHMDNPLVATVAVFACNRMMDQGDLPGARAAMEDLLAQNTGMTGLHRSLLECDLICCLLLAGEEEAAEARLTPALEKFRKSMKSFPSVLRTEYLLAKLHSDDPEQAAAIRTRFEQHAARYPYPAEIDSERQLMALADGVRV